MHTLAAMVLCRLHHLIELFVELGFDFVLEHGGQKAQLRVKLEVAGAHVQLALHAVAVKVQHIRLRASFIAALHTEFGMGFFSPSLGMLTGGGQTQRVLAFNGDVGHGPNL